MRHRTALAVVPNGSGAADRLVMPFGRMLGALRRGIAGFLLIVMGAWLYAQSVSAAQGGMVFAIVLLVVWAGAGIGSILGSTWGRLAGLGVAAAGVIIGLTLGTAGTEAILAPMLFSPMDALRWYVVQPVGYVLAVLSGLIGLLLMLPFRTTGSTPPPPDPGP